MDGCENSLQRQVIHTFVKEVFLWDDHAVIVLTLNNTQETVTFEEIREFEQLSDETQEPLPDESESGSCNIRFGSPGTSVSKHYQILGDTLYSLVTNINA